MAGTTDQKNPSPITNSTVEVVVGKRTMNVLTFTVQEAKSIRSMGTAISGAWAFVSLFVGANLAYALALVTQDAAFDVEHWVVICSLVVGAVLSALIGLWFRHIQSDTLDEILKSTQQPSR